MSQEAKHEWERKYVEHCTIYTGCVPTLQLYGDLLPRSSDKYCKFRYALRTRTGPRARWVEYNAYYWGYHAAAIVLAGQQPNQQVRPFCLLGEIRTHGDQLVSNGVTSLNNRGLWRVHARRDAEGSSYLYLPHPSAADDTADCLVSEHILNRSSGDVDFYLLMSGSIRDLQWNGCSGWLLWAQIRIWHEWERRGSRHLRKLKLLILAWWRDESKRDERWLSFGRDLGNDVWEIAACLGLQMWLEEDLGWIPGGNGEEETWSMEVEYSDMEVAAQYARLFRGGDGYLLEWPEEREICDEYWTF